MSAIALGPIPEIKEEAMTQQTTKMEIEEDGNQTRENKYFFADEVKIGEETVLKIDAENQFYEETKPARKSRWGDRPLKKSSPSILIFRAKDRCLFQSP